MSAWFYWLLAAVLLILLEVMTSGFVLLCLGISACLTAIISIIGISIEMQLFSFIIFTTITFVTIRPFMLKHIKPFTGNIETNILGMIGKEGVVVSTILSEKPGIVKIHGDEWTAISADNSMIMEGIKVKVINIDGNKIIVK